MLREHLDQPAPAVGKLGIELGIPMRDFEDLVQLVRGDLIRREDTESDWVVLNHLDEEGADSIGDGMQQNPKASRHSD